MAHIAKLFRAGHPLIGICAAGILIRATAAALNDKHLEPPVVAVSPDGLSIVPLLGGHHGANRLAQDLAQFLGGHAALTTAGDVSLNVALDDPPEGWVLANPHDMKQVSSALLNGEAAILTGAAAWIEDTSISFSPQGKVKLTISHLNTKPAENELIYHPRQLVLGVGCERGCSVDELIGLCQQTLQQHQLAWQSIAAVTSIELKSDEECILSLADCFGVEARFFKADELETQASRLKNPSDIVFAEVGCHGVCEGAALAAVGPDGKLIVSKQKSKRATCAIALAPAPLKALDIGKGVGELYVVGIGPGQDIWRTPEADHLIARADHLIGYSLYLDLLGPLTEGKERHDFPLGAETERCRAALELAGKGNRVALVCSGDAGIYAMAALVYELLDRNPDREGVSDAAKRVKIINAPGISALQAAAARAGAPLGHDFCTISLSDLLTPWQTIEQRITAAAQGDFVIAFYNPVSRRRRTQLETARQILLQHRASDTPVILATNLGREHENIRAVTLASLDINDVDMLTVVIVGSTQSKAFLRGNGKVAVYTPRGYSKKIANKENTQS
jgi:cobalt-precorrin 5A hydrolase / cobalt-factor III methyltransferase / precorrin-3B C17-methyltransferase